MNQNPTVKLADAIQNKQAAVLATGVNVNAAPPAEVVTRIVLQTNGETIGTARGGKLEYMILTDAQTAENILYMEVLNV